MSQNFGQFANAAPLISEFAVGYATAVSGGERRYQWGAVRTLLQSNLGSAAFTASSAYDAAGAAAAAQAASQPLDSDLTAIAALTTTAFGRSFLTQADTAASRTYIGLGSVENTALSTWAGSTSLITLGNVTTGTWNGTNIADARITSAPTWNAKESALAFNTGLARAANVVTVNASLTHVSGLGTITAGTWQANAIADAYLANAATWNAKESALTFTNGLARAVNVVTVNASQTQITAIGNVSTGTWSANTVAIGYGGTGLTTLVQGDLLYASAANTLARLADVAIGQVLVSGGAGANPAWSENVAVKVANIAGSAGIGINLGTTSARASLDAYGGDASAAAALRINGRKSRSNSVITVGDIPFQFVGYGHDGTDYTEAGSITLRTIGTIATSRVAAQWEFYAHPDSTAADYLSLTLGASAALFAANVAVTVSNSTAATSNTTGALVVTGGAGIGGSLYAANIFAHAYEVTNEIPLNTQNIAYTTVLTDAGKCIYHTNSNATAYTWTIASNANVAYQLGTALTFVNDASAANVTIAIAGGDTLILAGAGTTGSRTLAANGIATAYKMRSTAWLINGTNLT